MKKLIVSMAILLISASAYAAARYVACIYDVSGKVKVLKALEWKDAFKYMPLEEKDKIKTFASASCVIVLDDGTMLKLDENTELVLKQLKYEMQKQKYKFSLNSGKIIGSVNKIKTAGAKISFRTPTSVAAVRGTELAIIVSTDTTNIGLFDGKLAVSSAGDDEDEAEDEAGFLAPTTAYDSGAAVSTENAAPAKNEVMLEPNKEVIVAAQKGPEVKDYLSGLMEKEKRRAARLREIAEKVREKLQARADFLQDKISEQQKKIKEWDTKREERLKRYRK